MKLAMTMMVRDESDIIGAMVEHHLRQGVDVLIVTDNGSVDGTVDILEGFLGDGRVELRHDPVQHKQQSPTVTQMARDAYTKYDADWVLNADADEFWIPKNLGLTLAQAFEQIPRELGAFNVDVVDMTGPPAASGTGLHRLAYQDHRTPEHLNAVGLFAHSTHNVAHVGRDDVTVVQGNHFVNTASQGDPPPELDIMVHHFPWRSWEQFSTKVRNAGSAYENQTILTPSPNHHGMRDYRRLLDGTLLASYVLRHPSNDELAHGVDTGEFIRDDRISLSVPSPVADVALDLELVAQERALGLAIHRLESALASQTVDLRTTQEALAQARHHNDEFAERLALREAAFIELGDRANGLEQQNRALLQRRLVRLVDRLTTIGRLR